MAVRRKRRRGRRFMGRIKGTRRPRRRELFERPQHNLTLGGLTDFLLERHRMRLGRRLVAFVFLPIGSLIGCESEHRTPPAVLGISFGSELSSLRGKSLADTSSYANFPLMPFQGYRLSHANPENWHVFVNDSAPDLLSENRVFEIAISRNLGHSCEAGDREALVARVDSLYGAEFDARARMTTEDTKVSSTFLVDDRRLLSVNVRCWMSSVTAVFAYLDIDAFRYSDTAAVMSAISDTRTFVSEYNQRTLLK
jgi:hypothetical protein